MASKTYKLLTLLIVLEDKNKNKNIKLCHIITELEWKN